MRRKGYFRVADMYKLIQIIYQAYSMLACRNISRITSKQMCLQEQRMEQK